MCSDCAAGLVGRGGGLQVVDQLAAKAIVGYVEDRGGFCLTMNGKHFFFIAGVNSTFMPVGQTIVAGLSEG